MRPAETFVGNPCKYKHEGLRYKSTGACVHCALERAAKQLQLKKQAQLPPGQAA